MILRTMHRAARQMNFGFLERSEISGGVAAQSPIADREVLLPKGLDDDLRGDCVEILVKLGLFDLADRVSVVWNPRMRSCAGKAIWPAAEIQLNPRLKQVAENEVLPTLLHELAHLVAYERNANRVIRAHGSEWQQACAELGIPGEPATHHLALPSRQMKRRWRYVCPHCEHSFDRVRKFRKEVACYECCRLMSGGIFDARFRLVEVAL